ncbi:MAG: hypothetical protein IT317_08160 [Anaerolineales bacterium]|nr:hypothetical protein [Anaerolineales bacterium]
MATETKDTPQRPQPSFKHKLPEETIQHVKAAHQELRQSVEALLPPGFLEHRRAARREMLLAARSLIDAALRRVEAHAESGKPSQA